MSDMRNGMNDQRARRDICVDAYRILDSCKDKDCFEDTRLMLTDFGQEILERSGSVRVTNTSVVWTDITVDPLKFNRGFYQISIRFFTKVTLEACVGLGKAQEIEGIAVNEKKVVLFGGEGNVNIFRSGDMPDEFCSYGMGNETFIKSKPTAVVEVIDPVALSVKICAEQKKMCVCIPEEVPSCVTNFLNGTLTSCRHEREIAVTLGFFSVIRLERPYQFVVNALEYTVPEKVCRPVEESDPCAVFSRMNFPVGEFVGGYCE